MRRRLAGVAAIVIATGVLNGCASGSGGRSLEHPEKNQARYLMPTDAYADSESDNTMYAENVFISKCFAEKGLEYPVEHRTLREDGNASWNTVTRLLFDESTARQFGYHQQVGTGGMTPEEIRRGFEGPELTPEGERLFSKCLGDAREELGTEQQIEQYATELAVDAYDATLVDPEVKAATARWRECMKPLGISGLDASPSGPPSDELNARFGLSGDILPTEDASAEEIRIAVFDARCQESSGYAKTIYDTEWAFQQELVEKNADKLLRVKAQIDAKNARVHEYIAEHAPSK
ncbi:hypothetical protein EDF46_2158 [Frondihabitans sp. PhB188]|uniref:hypothetical protein n=1 Tax=Frondihabitans sp. PhB188 TaxID=2485200 RepID=UPI000F9A9BA9|nr:hypothetical protein [Frondihabitans sp. PhB188]ROQ38520.1 hypothetical protein EDF46_2158 [Frondihabitans sp. PhB188]